MHGRVPKTRSQARYMFALGWASFVVALPQVMAATECLVGCMLNGTSPFDDENVVAWDLRETCDSETLGCEVSAINYPPSSYSSYLGALWVSTSGIDGSSGCTCDICDPSDQSGYPIDYMEDEGSLWTRIQCYLAAAEASGWDVSPCVSAILDGGTLPCVDVPYEAPAVDQFACEENGISNLATSSSYDECAWAGLTRSASEMFPSTSASSTALTTSAGPVADTTECLVGCMLLGIDLFDNDTLWDQRQACDSTTIGCDVSAINYPPSAYSTYLGALWVSTTGNDGSSGCTCDICDPYDNSDELTEYMEDEGSLWTRIQCYVAAAEASGWDVSPCVSAIVDGGTLPCVDVPYEAPAVDQFACEENGISNLATSSSYDECAWAGEARSASEMFPSTSASSTALTTSAGPVANTTECLVGCMLLGIDLFDNDTLWDQRQACDSTTIGCDVSAINYPPSAYSTYLGALWVATSGSDGSSGCTCDICDPYDNSDELTEYMEDEGSLWTRIQCYVAAAEASGWDVSPCVSAIVDGGTLPCVDVPYEAPAVDQFSCEENGISNLATSSSYDECAWAGEARSASEMFPSTSASSTAATTPAGPVANTTECMVGCMLLGIDLFDNDTLWDQRQACDSTTIGCDVNFLPSSFYYTEYDGALWVSTSGSDGSSDCTCDICNPYELYYPSNYMEEEDSLWTRIQCYLAAAEASGWDVSPCVSAIIDDGTLPCVDVPYEAPTVGQFACEASGMSDLETSSSYDVCTWAGEARGASEMFGVVSNSSSSGSPPTSATTPAPSSPALSPTPGSLPSATTAPGIRTPSPSTVSDSTIAPADSEDDPELPPSNTEGEPVQSSAPSTSAPLATVPPVIAVDITCDVGQTCPSNLCCHPDYKTCGRKYTFCQERDMFNGAQCCSGVDGDPSADNVCSEDYICDEPEEDDGQPIGEAVAMWTGIAASGLAIFVGVWQGYEWGKRRKGRERAKKASPPEEKQNETTASAS